MKRKKYIFESDQNIIIKVIGDHVANLIDGSDDYLTTTIDEKNMTVVELIERLKTEEESPETDYLFVSIGTQDFFSDIEYVNYLCDLIYEIYPNAKYYVIEGFLGEEDLIDFDEDEYDDIEKQRKIYYSEFAKNGFDVIGTNLFSDESNETNSTEILNIKKEISSLTMGDINIIGLNKDKEVESLETDDINLNDDDETDFDTIYEFLDRFEKIVKSKNVYSNSSGNRYDPNVHQIEIALRFLLPNYVGHFKSEGIFDVETEEAIKAYQVSNGIKPTGVADSDLLEDIYYDLKVEGFDNNDIGKFLSGDDMGHNSGEDIFLDGKVDHSNAGLSSEQEKNVKLMISYMNGEGITNPYTQIGILSVIGKESGFIPQNEICYNTTDDSRIKEVFGNCRTNAGKILLDWGTTLSELKKDCEKFFDAMYGKKAEECLGWKTGNNQPGDGYKYRGRGFNGITFKSIYSKYGGIIGEDLVSDPDKLNEPEIAAKAAVAFFTDGKTPPDFDNKQDATDYFVNVNAGGSSSWKESFENANQWMNKFEVIGK